MHSTCALQSDRQTDGKVVSIAQRLPCNDRWKSPALLHTKTKTFTACVIVRLLKNCYSRRSETVWIDWQHANHACCWSLSWLAHQLLLLIVVFTYMKVVWKLLTVDLAKWAVAVHRRQGWLYSSVDVTWWNWASDQTAAANCLHTPTTTSFYYSTESDAILKAQYCTSYLSVARYYLTWPGDSQQVLLLVTCVCSFVC